jgi:DNA-directed RNA polymerase specialized sigma24 family protein
MTERLQAASAAIAPANDAFAALMRRLRVDGGDALAYESLRRRLIQFFRLHLPADADDLADVVLDRLARKIHEGTDVASVPSYALGIARMVLHEARARSARRHLAESDPTFAPEPDDVDDAAENANVLAALTACLEAAGATAQRLILSYYGDDDASRIATRRKLAEQNGISLNALRNRALRLRDALENCVRSRTNPATGA